MTFFGAFYRLTCVCSVVECSTFATAQPVIIHHLLLCLAHSLLDLCSTIKCTGVRCLVGWLVGNDNSSARALLRRVGVHRICTTLQQTARQKLQQIAMHCTKWQHGGISNVHACTRANCVVTGTSQLPKTNRSAGGRWSYCSIM